MYITGTTASPDFPTTPGAIQGNLTGKKNAFVAGLDSSGSHLTWSTYLGGSGDDENNALGIDPQGDLYLTGTTTSADFPVTNGSYLRTFVKSSDAFIARLDPANNRLIYSTFLPGPEYIYANAIAVDDKQTAYVTGMTGSGLPTTPGALSKAPGIEADAYLVKMLCVDRPAVDFAATPVDARSFPVSVQFNTTSTGGPVSSWSWDFGDGEVSSEENPLHIYKSPGMYAVILIAGNDAGSYPKIRTYTLAVPMLFSDNSTMSEVQYTATGNSSPVVLGDPLHIHGVAQNPGTTSLRLWVIGRNYVNVTSCTVNPDHSFDFEIPGNATKQLSPGTYTIIAQEPGYGRPPGIDLDTTSGEIVDKGRNISLFTVQDARSIPETDAAQALIQAIRDPASGDLSTVYEIPVIDLWITIDPLDSVYKDTITVTGSTNVPVGQVLDISVETTSMHPTPQVYDWSHEEAGGNATVFAGNATANAFSALIDGSKLNPGEYLVSVQPDSGQYPVEQSQIFDLLPAPSRTPEPTNVIDWPNLTLPKFQVNASITPVIISQGIVLVQPGEQKEPYQIPYGAIMLYSPEGIVRVFDAGGTQISALYDSNQLRMMEVPNGAMVSDAGNVTRITLNGQVILTGIHEAGSR